MGALSGIGQWLTQGGSGYRARTENIKSQTAQMQMATLSKLLQESQRFTDKNERIAFVQQGAKQLGIDVPSLLGGGAGQSPTEQAGAMNAESSWMNANLRLNTAQTTNSEQAGALSSMTGEMSPSAFQRPPSVSDQVAGYAHNNPDIPVGSPEWLQLMRLGKQGGTEINFGSTPWNTQGDPDALNDARLREGLEDTLPKASIDRINKTIDSELAKIEESPQDAWFGFKSQYPREKLIAHYKAAEAAAGAKTEEEQAYFRETWNARMGVEQQTKGGKSLMGFGAEQFPWDENDPRISTNPGTRSMPMQGNVFVPTGGAALDNIMGPMRAPELPPAAMDNMGPRMAPELPPAAPELAPPPPGIEMKQPVAKDKKHRTGKPPLIGADIWLGVKNATIKDTGEYVSNVIWEAYEKGKNDPLISAKILTWIEDNESNFSKPQQRKATKPLTTKPNLPFGNPMRGY